MMAAPSQLEQIMQRLSVMLSNQCLQRKFTFDVASDSEECISPVNLAGLGVGRSLSNIMATNIPLKLA
ncbi:MAG: hypothetical protein AAFY11_15410 [Cyanobacteria bacterium J06641_5]